MEHRYLILDGRHILATFECIEDLLMFLAALDTQQEEFQYTIAQRKVKIERS